MWERPSTPDQDSCADQRVCPQRVATPLTTEGVIAISEKITPQAVQQCNYGKSAGGFVNVAPVHDRQTTDTQTLISFVFVDAHLSLNCWHAHAKQSVGRLIITTLGSHVTVHV